ncbi:MAG: SDR family oxidoreductase [Deltaproteobacteria bacterium]|nr:SDR family oxidoreductase [Deltaproteobacteria bacterium]
MKSVVITGSSKGIGLGLAKEFLKKGCSVMFSSFARAEMEQECEKAAAEFGKDRVACCHCDMTDLAQVQNLWEATVKAFGKVDIWMNNAGIANTTRLFWELEAKEIPRVVSTNMAGIMYGSHVAIKGMLAQGFGAIYNSEGFGSDDMFVNGLAVYGATKRGGRYFTEALAEEVSKNEKPVIVGTISPGIVLTDFLLDDMRKMPPDILETTKAVYNSLADTVEVVTPWLVEEVLGNTENGKRIIWLTEEKANARFESEEYYTRDLFTQHGL